PPTEVAVTYSTGFWASNGRTRCGGTRVRSDCSPHSDFHRGGKGTSESRMKVSIEQIFDLQELCLHHALPMVMEEFTFIKRCIELILNHRVRQEVIDELDDDDRERIRAVNTYLNESL